MNEHDLLIKLIGMTPQILTEYPELCENKEYVTASMVNTQCLRHWPKNLIVNKKLIIDFVKCQNEIINNLSYQQDIDLSIIDDFFLNDIEFLKEAFRLSTGNACLFIYTTDACINLHRDADFINELIQNKNVNSIKCERLSNELKNDKELIKRFLELGRINLLESSSYLTRTNILFAYECIKINPDARHYFGKKVTDIFNGKREPDECLIEMEKYLLRKKLIKTLPIKGIKQEILKI